MSETGQVGVVVIGRNEGDRLKRCLRSLKNDCPIMVYVDSGSADDSVQFARSLHVDVVDLDLSRPFTMARGRNEGFFRLCALYPQIEFVQFVDGDCEVAAGWISAAKACLKGNADVVAVCGRRREQAPHASRFNLLCDLEWDKAPGETRSCGGDAMFRIGPLKDVGGYNEQMIAGEEGDLCFRLRARGWKVLRINHEMTRHDAAITSWSQWIKRAIRGGHAFAEGAFLHGASDERYNVRSTRSALFWGALVPLFCLLMLAAALLSHPLILVAMAVPILGYLFLGYRVYRESRYRGRRWEVALMSAWFCLIAKTPEAIGVLQFRINRLCGRRSQLIEYK
jgi:GT2 family glycosyltransferase